MPESDTEFRFPNARITSDLVRELAQRNEGKPTSLR
jgi:hypothetical protein